MKLKHQLSIQRLIAKVDNDFNISESDWIPRVAAWTIDALSQMKCLPMEKKSRTLEVSERIARFPCMLNAQEIEVYDSSGRKINNLEDKKTCGNSGSGINTDSEIAVFNSAADNPSLSMTVVPVYSGSSSRNFVIQGDNIELNFDDTEITVKSYEVATYYDDYFDCDVPYVYDNGLLLEALSWYIMFKYLSRGSKHPVYNLSSNSPVINPYLHWNELRPKAAASVKSSMLKDEGWRNFFYNSTFDPRG